MVLLMPEKQFPYDCPHCGVEIPEGDYDEYTVGVLDFGQEFYPHIVCPHCGSCVGCEEKDGKDTPGSTLLAG